MTKQTWDGTLPVPADMRFTADDYNAMAGSGSTTLTVAASDALHPERADYTCPGTADQVMIQSAITALPAMGGRIIFSEGHYNLTAAITVPSNVWLQGQGAGTIFERTSGNIQLMTNAAWAGGNTNIHISDLHCDGNRGAAYNSGDGGMIHLVNCSNSSIRNCFCECGLCHGIELVKSIGIIIDSCITDDNGDDGISLDDGHYAPGGSAGAAISKNILISNCICSNHVRGVGAGLEINDGVSCVRYVNCEAHDNNRGFDIHTHTGEAPPAFISYSNCIAYNNTALGGGTSIWDGAGFVNWSEAAPATAFDVGYSGCVARGNGGAGFALGDAPTQKIQDCSSIDNTGHGIRLDGDCVDVLIEGNYLVGPYILGTAIVATQGGINVHGSFARIQIVNNMIRKNAYRGINIKPTTSTVKDVIISNNTIRESASCGILIGGSPLENVIIANNILKNNGQAGAGNTNEEGITVYASSNTTKVDIHNNTVYDDQSTKTQQVGLHLWEGAGIALAATIHDNDLTGNAVSAIKYALSTGGAGIFVRDNIGVQPGGTSAIGVTASPFTYTAGFTPETVYIRGGTISDIAKAGLTLFVDTDHSIDVEPHGNIIVTYSSIPVMIKDAH